MRRAKGHEQATGDGPAKTDDAIALRFHFAIAEAPRELSEDGFIFISNDIGNHPLVARARRLDFPITLAR